MEHRFKASTFIALPFRSPLEDLIKSPCTRSRIALQPAKNLRWNNGAWMRISFLNIL